MSEDWSVLNGAEAWALRSRRVVTPTGIREAAVIVSGSLVIDVAAPEAVPPTCPIVDVGDLAVLPGLIDAHVHINEPGRTDWEGFETATRAAAAGGITTLADMPLNSSPVTTTPGALAAKRAAARGKLWVDCGFYGGLIPGNADQVGPLADAGVLGFKAFLCPSGIDEFPNVTEADLRAAMPAIARRGLPLLVHAELPGPVRSSPDADPRSYAAYLASRPAVWEHEAIRLLIELCRQTGCRVQIVHLSSAESLPMIAEARREGLPLTVETCPHYLTFAAEEIPDGETRFKCAPPIRGRENRDRLWEGLRAGLIDTIGSDHSPAPPDLKQFETGDLQRAWGGIASLQLALPAVWTEASRRGFNLSDVTRWMGQAPEELLRLGGIKSEIAPGRVADLVVLDPEATFDVSPGMIQHRHKQTPYKGRTLRGKVEATILSGTLIYESGQFHGGPSGIMISPADQGRD
jgi:allantoinase